MESHITVEHKHSDEPEVLLEERARNYPFSYDPEEMPDLARSIERHHPDPDGEVDRWARRFVNLGGPTETGALLMTLTYAIKEGFSYERRTARGTQSPLQTLASRRGSCRDFATLMMEAARALGLAARFVTGYLYVPDRDTGETLISAAARLMRGAKSICPAPAGWSSIPPMGSSAIATSSGSRSRAMRVRPFRCTASITATPRADEAWWFRSCSKPDESEAEASEHATPEAVRRCGSFTAESVVAPPREGHMLIQAGFDIAFQCPALDADAAATQHPSLARRRSALARRHLFRSAAGDGRLSRSLRQPRHARRSSRPASSRSTIAS